MRINRNLIASVLILLLTSLRMVKAQDALMSYMPSVAAPSPTPYSFTSYGNIPIEGNDGAFSTSIPLFSQRYRDIDMAISLGYKSGGIAIDELGGTIGTGWVLNGGGAVTRVMRGLPDEQAATRWYPLQINPGNTLDYSNILNSASGLGVDTEQDWFSYNVNGISGKFYLDANLNVIVVGGNDEKVVLEITNNTSNYGNLLKFTITDTRGYRYVFGGELNFIEGSMLNRDCFVGPKPTFQSVWFLKEIISPKNTVVTFEYQGYSIDNVSSVVHNRSYGQTCGGNTLSPHKVTISDCVYSTRNLTRALSKITFGLNSLVFTYDNVRLDGGGLKLKNIKLLSNVNVLKSVDFLYEEVLSTRSIDEPKLQTSNKLKYRYFLKGLLFSGESNVLESKYTFEYYDKEQLPPRFSYSRDKFGYFNNRPNYSPFSAQIKAIDGNALAILNQAGGTAFATADNEVNESTVYYGLLSKIIYPTGGYTEVIYEPNKTKGVSTSIEPIFDRITALLACGVRETVSTYRFVSNGQGANFTASATYEDSPAASCVNNPDPLHDLHVLSVVDVATNAVIYSLTKKVGEPLEGSVGTTNGRQYEIRYKLTSRFNALYGAMDIFYNSHTVSRETDKFGGGSRLKSLINVSEAGKTERRNFYYNILANIDSDSNTLHVPYLPRYHEISQVKVSCGGLMVETDYLRVTSSNINQLFNFRGTQIFYGAITEAVLSDNNQSNGYTESLYNVIEDNAPFVEFGPMIYGVPYSNISEGMLGKIGRKRWYDSLKNLKKEEVYEYQLLQEGSNKNWVFRKNYDISGANNPSIEMEAGSYSAVHYFNNFIDWKLRKITSNDYQSPVTLTSDIVQEYGGNGHKQITKKTRMSSDGKSDITTYFYAPELLSSNIAYASDLVQQNRLDPIRIQKYSGTKMVMEETGEFTNMNNLVLLKSVNKKYGPEQGRVDESVNITRFDSYGNPLEMNAQANPASAYVWGYGGQYPILEIKNATYAEVAAVLTQAAINNLNISTHTEATMETLIRNASVELRNSLPQAMVSSYTYKPLVGMTSKTDPRGITEYYRYDGMQRLQAILDHLNYVNKSFDYHYRPN